MAGQLTQKVAIKRAVEVLSKGVTRTAAVGYIGMTRSTFYEWMKTRPEFAKAVVDAESKARVAVELSLMKGAVAGDRLSQMFWLQNRFPDDWVNVSKVEIDHKVGVQVIVVEPEFDVTGRSELKSRAGKKELKRIV